MQILRAGLLYFTLVFGAGFILGTIRTLWLVPRLGQRTAELIEEPIMFAVIVLASRWVIQRIRVPPRVSARLGVGFVALGLLLIAELGVTAGIQRLTLSQYIASRDPVAGTVYLIMLGVFAAMPVVVSRR